MDDHPGHRPWTYQSEMGLPRPTCPECQAAEYVETRQSLGPGLPQWVLVSCAKCGHRVRSERARQGGKWK